jgi:transposase
MLTGQSIDTLRWEKEFRVDWDSLLAARAWAISKLPPGQDTDQLRYCVESTGTYHCPVLRAWRGCPTVVNPMLAGPTRRKTDVLDARLLAHHSITGLWKPSFIPSEDGQVLRVLWAKRREALRLATRCGNRINNILLRFGHTFGSANTVRSQIGGAIVEGLIEGGVPSLKGVCPDGLPADIRLVLKDLYDQMRQQLHQVKQAVVAAENFIKARDWPIEKGTIPGTQLLNLLRTVPGIGQSSSLTWLAEVLDPRRFHHDKQVAAYAGCDPSLKVSAGKVTAHTRRRGNERVHQALLYAASGVLRSEDSHLGQWGRSIAGRHKSGGHRRACSAVARRLAVILWHVHRKGEPFSYDQYNFARKLVVPQRPIKGLFPERAVALLEQQGFKTTRQLAAAWLAGTLGRIPGIGDITLAQIHEWIKANEQRSPAKSTTTNGSAPSGTPASRIYTLDPSRALKPKRAKRKTIKTK